MFKKILIANRGEIAVRIIKTCQKLGIRTAAVYSEADRRSLHVKQADEAYFIGGSRVKESYLNIDNLLRAAKEANADAIHPGYGFLSENAEFAEVVAEKGITFIGPLPYTVRKMGNKLEARKKMMQAGVPVIPGATISPFSELEAVKAARTIGFPLMVKAAAGGGGIGMQLVEHEQELLTAVATVVKKAETFFGSGDIYFEKYIKAPRHIEAQIAGDSSGNIKCIGERECSIQRRHQKIIEEAPAVFLSGGGRHKLHDLAEQAAKSIGYTNVGTVEFLVDTDENIFFLEMNTRLQVEHAVTEETAGIDLVEWQIRLAAGEQLSALTAAAATADETAEHAMEARIYAEDPNTFFPSPGTISKWRFPSAEGVRYDFGVEEGTAVTPFYDPLIGKVIAFGSTRAATIDLLIQCLRQAEVDGIKTNIPLLLRILTSDDFQKGTATTVFVTEQQMQ
ncbi:acetyl-CoA carboxylase, biotin carboxylase subunit [Evansella caseinilytica]|uniref:biotin carboxylase n=1 Tax=Evansella caseinilytica TaxID=1503961 RepID=A0A1H3QQZ5_9BACI|nr:biotin carboxylase N-terminal domain-containing protein [Evansella caseinilytica]SDZ15846.1 acetyl-CoA carboxylase, biotin carboxylase subunit [Evansella caseinilytica]